MEVTDQFPCSRSTLKSYPKFWASAFRRFYHPLISQDQTGFYPGRHSCFNTRRLLNILYSSSYTSPEVFISSDADRVDWNYLFIVLEKFGLGSNFISWLRLLYTSPVAAVCTNGMQSSSFLLHRGPPQGCPLSPLHFNLAIEPLAIWLRNLEAFEGISRFGLMHKLSLYVDELLLFVSNPCYFIPLILKVLDDFGCLSGKLLWVLFKLCSAPLILTLIIFNTECHLVDDNLDISVLFFLFKCFPPLTSVVWWW